MERWKKIPGWNQYEVSNYGRVRSLPRTVFQVLGRSKIKRTRKFKGKILKNNHHSMGYEFVTLSSSKRRWCVTVHKLVTLAFKGKCPKGLEVCHANGNRKDNRLSNLRYGTRSSNALDRHKHGTMCPAKGEEAGSAKLKESQVLWMRKQNGKLSFRAMGRKFGVSHHTVSAAIRGQSWGHL